MMAKPNELDIMTVPHLTELGYIPVPSAVHSLAGRPAPPVILRFQNFWLREVEVHSPEN